MLDPTLLTLFRFCTAIWGLPGGLTTGEVTGRVGDVTPEPDREWPFSSYLKLGDQPSRKVT
ncbi:hypothetical protein Tdes44962_MAKER05595 [Teratosphaeria destructans]|uniref:Uncharacterized protein n=1 Tax=Teratosphaeria destructans TaxID=418781 RepID=A0A9W7VYX2_9PEZI|nr:hypothetical protein Tdes44962_MAKER05595 [Teratosphaeria destructans]